MYCIRGIEELMPKVYNYLCISKSGITWTDEFNEDITIFKSFKEAEDSLRYYKCMFPRKGCNDVIISNNSIEICQLIPTPVTH